MWSFSGFIGPKFSESNLTTIADYEVLEMSDFVIGANIDGKHFVGSNWGRDIKNPDIEADLRYAENGDYSPDGAGKISIKRGIEVGHTFFLGKNILMQWMHVFQRKMVLINHSKWDVLELGLVGF